MSWQRPIAVADQQFRVLGRTLHGRWLGCCELPPKRRVSLLSAPTRGQGVDEACGTCYCYRPLSVPLQPCGTPRRECSKRSTRCATIRRRLRSCPTESLAFSWPLDHFSPGSLPL